MLHGTCVIIEAMCDYNKHISTFKREKGTAADTTSNEQLTVHLQVWEQQRDELKVTWRAIRQRIDAYATDAAANSSSQQQQSPYTPGGISNTPGSRSKPYSPFLGVPQLAAARAGSRAQVTKTPTGPVASQQLQRLKELLEEQNQAIADAREKLAGLFEEVEAWRIEHPEVELPGRLRGQIVV